MKENGSHRKWESTPVTRGSEENGAHKESGEESRHKEKMADTRRETIWRTQTQNGGHRERHKMADTEVQKSHEYIYTREEKEKKNAKKKKSHKGGKLVPQK